MLLRSAVPALLLLLLTACASANTDSADYHAGYSDGCASGSSADSYSRHRVIRDENAFRNNTDYKSGWRSGYNTCVVKSGQDPFARERSRDRF